MLLLVAAVLVATSMLGTLLTSCGECGGPPSTDLRHAEHQDEEPDRPGEADETEARQAIREVVAAAREALRARDYAGFFDSLDPHGQLGAIAEILGGSNVVADQARSGLFEEFVPFANAYAQLLDRVGVGIDRTDSDILRLAPDRLRELFVGLLTLHEAHLGHFSRPYDHIAHGEVRAIRIDGDRARVTLELETPTGPRERTLHLWSDGSNWWIR